MTATVKTPKNPPIAPLWFETIQLVGPPVPGPQLPTGSRGT
jgi:hypothetical protein